MKKDVTPVAGIAKHMWNLPAEECTNGDLSSLPRFLIFGRSHFQIGDANTILAL